MTSSGFLLVDKPEGWTSFDVVAKLRSSLSGARKQAHTQRGFCAPDSNSFADHVCKCKRFKVGHSGTLDPAATGLLLIAYGKSTKELSQLIKQDKVYEVNMTFGVHSSTGDKEGDLEEHKNSVQPDEASIGSALEHFTGVYDQVPPAFSALKVDGVRAYDLARKGIEVELKSRPVQILSLELINYDYPELKLTAHVGSGTYIRSLVVDIASELGAVGYMSDLRRTRIGAYDIADALTVDKAIQKIASEGLID